MARSKSKPIIYRPTGFPLQHYCLDSSKTGEELRPGDFFIQHFRECKRVELFMVEQAPLPPKLDFLARSKKPEVQAFVNRQRERAFAESSHLTARRVAFAPTEKHEARVTGLEHLFRKNDCTPVKLAQG